jgi:pyruvate/2-oxoglutarate dehydrogenase complex dihydrolipoamide acyltransferase (E2) component
MSELDETVEMDEMDALRALIRDVIRDVLPRGIPETETVNLSTDEDLAEFVTRLLDLDPGQREDLLTGRKRFRLAVAPPPATQAPPATQPPRAAPAAAAARLAQAPPAAAPSANGTRRTDGVRRIDSGAVTEAVIRDAARAGQRLVLGRAAVLTPLARDRARASGVQIEKER